MYKISIKDKNDYDTIIKYLFSKCDMFQIVDMYPNADYKSRILNNLSTLCLSNEYVNEWSGTCIIPEAHSNSAKKYVLPCNKETLNILKKYSNFFELKELNGIKYYESFNEEEQLDISFFYKDKCILYTITHEGICLVEEKFFKDLFKSNNISFEKWN